ncbi:MAG TPA: DUF3037 domain-containing protein [Ktedonobacterales bacterium]|nr:DUF3037 domain-containing protein [Ktedonobacterales bacterium]
MPVRSSFDYAIVRIVPRVERGERINAGAILYCRARAFLRARIELDHARLAALAPDLDPTLILAQLELIPLICVGGAVAGPIGQLSQQQRFHWLTSPRSTIIQTSPAHAGLCADPEAALEHLLATMVRPLPPPAG